MRTCSTRHKPLKSDIILNSGADNSTNGLNPDTSMKFGWKASLCDTFPKSIMSHLKFSKWPPFSRRPPKIKLIAPVLGVDG